MSNYTLPNTFQTPNSYVDAAMGMLSSEEYKCLSFATRHILGWQDKISKRRGFISLSMFENGFISSKGIPFGGTGLTRPTIIRATDELTRLLFLIKIGEPTAEGQEWELGDAPDFDALTERYESRKESRRKQTANARETKRGAGMSDKPPQAGMSNKPEVVKPTNQRRSVGQTSGGLSNKLNQTHGQTHPQTHVQTSADGAGDSKSLAALIEAWLNASKVIAPNAYANKTIRAKALAMHRLGVQPQHITDFIADLRSDKFWATKGIQFEKVCADIRSWLDEKRAGWNGTAGATTKPASSLPPLSAEPYSKEWGGQSK